MIYKSSFALTVEQYCRECGGTFNAHCHVDRFATLLDSAEGEGADHNPLTSYSLWDKVTTTATLHRGRAYSRDSLAERIDRFLEISARCGTRRVDSFIDVDTDIPLSEGLGALEVAIEMKLRHRDTIDFRVGAYVPSGFRKGDDRKRQLFEEAVKHADFIGASPERDDWEFYPGAEDQIGLREHFEWTLDLAISHRKPVHYHLDQQVSPRERGTEALLKILETTSLGRRLPNPGNGEPLVWAVHAISPSTYPRERLERMIGKMAELNVGLVCCPSAALSMRKLPIFSAPIPKSIAEVLPMLNQGIRTRLGTDNVDDIFVPANSVDLRQEVGTLANALRFYNVPVLAKIACGRDLSAGDRAFVASHLENEERYLENFKSTANYPI